MCFDVSMPIRLICSTDGLLCLRSTAISFWHARCRRGPSTPTDGRGRGVAEDVRGNPDVDRSATSAARASMTRRRDRMRETTTAEVRLDHGNAVGSGIVGRAVQRFGSQSGRSRSNFVAARLDETEDHTQRAGNLGNVGSFRLAGRQIPVGTRWSEPITLSTLLRTQSPFVLCTTRVVAGLRNGPESFAITPLGERRQPDHRG
jgi:hypothetical protein